MNEELRWVKYLDRKLRKQKTVDLGSLKKFKQEIESFFPQDGKWYSSCFNQPKDLTYNNLPCHLRDIDWMSRLLYQGLDGSVSQSSIKKFMATSADFAKLRHDYELRIVQWQINWIMDGGDNWLLPKGFDELSILCSPDIDKMVRGGVVKTLRAIGMNHEVVEEGLEKYANQWRKASMELGYDNLFNPIYQMSEISNEREPIDKEHKANWLADREYNYYQEHKRMVDKYGTTTPAMEMTPADHAKLLTVLNQQNADHAALLAAKSNQRRAEHATEPARKKTFVGGIGGHLIKKMRDLLGDRENESITLDK